MNGISVVIPVFNEEENVEASYRELHQVLSSMGREFELIFVDDGSRDATKENLLRSAKNDPRLVLIEFRRNFGQTAAMAAGFAQTRFDIVVAIDGDLQNDPSEIPRMVERLEEGFDMVAGWRKDRQDKFLSRRLPSMIANFIISRSTGVHLHDYGCTLKVMTGEIARGIKLYGEMHRFIPALAAEIGARITEVPVNHRPRMFGTSKYGITRTFRVLLDLLTVKFLLGYSKRPIHFFGAIGFLSGGVGALILFIMSYQKLFHEVSMGNRPLLSLGVILLILGVQFMLFGLLGEVMARTYYESQEKPIYVIRRIFRVGQEDLPQADKDLKAEGDTPWNRKAAN